MNVSRKRISVSNALAAFPILVLLGAPVTLFWEYPQWQATPAGWLFVCTVGIPIMIVLLVWEVLVGTANAKIQNPFLGFSVYRVLQVLFWIAVAGAYFYAFESLFPNLHDLHFVRR